MVFFLVAGQLRRPLVSPPAVSFRPRGETPDTNRRGARHSTQAVTPTPPDHRARGAAAWRARPLPVPSPWPPSPRPARSPPRLPARWGSRGVSSPPRESRRAAACASWPPVRRWTRSRRELPSRRLRAFLFRPVRPRRARRCSLSPK